jgi:hypothetical protein
VPRVLLVAKPLGNLDSRRVGFKCLIKEHLAFRERTPDNGARRGGRPTATAVGGVRENARVSDLMTPGPEACQRPDPITLEDGRQVERRLVETGVPPSILAALQSECFDRRGVAWPQKPRVMCRAPPEMVWPEVALIRRPHQAIEVTPEDSSEEGLVHQMLFVNLQEPALQVRYPALRG